MNECWRVSASRHEPLKGVIFEQWASNFAQTHPGKICRLFLLIPGAVDFCAGGFMAILNKDKHTEYIRFATHCLEMVARTRDQATRGVQREMAAEWLRLADAAPFKNSGLGPQAT